MRAQPSFRVALSVCVSCSLDCCMHLFFDFMVWPRTPWPTISMRITCVVLRVVCIFFVFILVLATQRIIKNYICCAEGCVTGVKINHGVSFAKNSRSKSLIFVGI